MSRRSIHLPVLRCRTVRRGSVLMEFVLAFPLILIMLLACMQLAHMWLARQVVFYSAFSAARATLTAHPSEYAAVAQQAAEQVCAWIIIGQANGEVEKKIPGWGPMPGSGGVARKTRTRVKALGEWNIEVQVEFDFGLVYPLAGPLIGWAMNPWDKGSAWAEQESDPTGNAHRYIDSVEHPHIIFRENAIIAKPFKTMYPTGVPVGGW